MDYNHYIFFNCECRGARVLNFRVNRHLLSVCTARRLVELLLARGADVNAQTEAHKTPLMLASFAGQLDTVKLLLARGADLHAKDKSTELH